MFLEEIAEDEEKHRATVKDIGSEHIPESIKGGMSTFSKIMKKITYYIWWLERHINPTSTESVTKNSSA